MVDLDAAWRRVAARLQAEFPGALVVHDGALLVAAYRGRHFTAATESGLRAMLRLVAERDQATAIRRGCS